MPNQLSADRIKVLSALETTYGTDAVEALFTDPTADLIYNELATPLVDPERQIVEFDRARGSQSGNAHRTVEVQSTVSTTIPLTGLRGNTATDSVPTWEAFARSMGLRVTNAANGTRTYAPGTTQQGSLTFYQWHRQLASDEWRLVYSTGVRGSGEIVFAIDEETVINFSGTGLYQGVFSPRTQFFSPTTGAAALLKDRTTAVTARTTGDEFDAKEDPILGRCMTVTVNGIVFPITALSLNLNWTLALVRTLNACNGVSEVLLTRPSVGSRIGGSFSLLDGEDAFDEMMARYEDGAEVGLEVEATSRDGSSGASRLSLSAPNLQIGRVPAPGNSDGLVSFDVPFFLNGDFTNPLVDNDFAMTLDFVP